MIISLVFNVLMRSKTVHITIILRDSIFLSPSTTHSMLSPLISPYFLQLSSLSLTSTILSYTRTLLLRYILDLNIWIITFLFIFSSIKSCSYCFSPIFHVHNVFLLLEVFSLCITS